MSVTSSNGKDAPKRVFFRKPSEIGKRIMRHATVQIRTPYNPWDWYIYLHEWLILMVNVGKLYHTWIACLVNFLLGWTTGESHQITWSAEAKGSRKLVQPPSEVIKRCRSTSQVDLQDIFKSGLVDSWRTCRRRKGSLGEPIKLGWNKDKITHWSFVPSNLKC